MSVPSAQRNKVQKVTDRFFTGGGLSMSRITEDNLPTSQSSQPLAMGTSTKHTPPQTAKIASISANKQKGVQANNLGVSSVGSVDPTAALKQEALSIDPMTGAKWWSNASSFADGIKSPS